MSRHMRGFGLISGLVLFCTAMARASTPIDHVLIISVDGLRSDALLAARSGQLPNFRRVMNGSGTLNARTDVHFTLTMPNHVSMVTGRVVLGETGHQWQVNQLSRFQQTIHECAGLYVSSMYDVAHDHGVHTGLFVSKLKLALLDESWNKETGAADVTGEDNGRDKVDTFYFEPTKAPAPLTNELLAMWEQKPARSLALIHYGTPDAVGHAMGWDLTEGSAYLQSLSLIDRHLGELLEAIDQSEHLNKRTALIITADHGGGAPFFSHTHPDMWINYIIPFLVWCGDHQPAVELYRFNSGSRKDPGLSRPGFDPKLTPQAASQPSVTPLTAAVQTPDSGAAKPPIRNGDAGNLALDLLGLPPIPGSTLNAKQDLKVAFKSE